jgi:hypothetical protein
VCAALIAMGADLNAMCVPLIGACADLIAM